MLRSLLRHGELIPQKEIGCQNFLDPRESLAGAKRAPGLKPILIRFAYAALKGRSFTAATALTAGDTSRRCGAGLLRNPLSACSRGRLRPWKCRRGSA